MRRTLLSFCALLFSLSAQAGTVLVELADPESNLALAMKNGEIINNRM